MKASETIRYWEEAAEKYCSVQESSDFSAQNRRLVEDRFAEIGAMSVLDAGCGYGRYTDWFAKQGAKVTGCDGAAAMIRLARERYPHSRFDLVDLTEDLPYQAGSFDLVFCNQVLMDLPEIAHTLSEFARVLRTQGRLWLSIVHPAFYIGEWVTGEDGKKRAKEISGYLTPHSREGDFWGRSLHYHRPVSYYLNLAARNGLSLLEMVEPRSYDPKENQSDLPLFLCAEFEKR